MKSYPSIPHWNKGLFGENCVAFEKLDGSLIRAEWSKKNGWYKFGTKKQLIAETDEQFGQAVTLFNNKYSEGLQKVFRDKYRDCHNFIVFLEYYGEQSFAGTHVEGDKMDVVLFDVS